MKILQKIFEENIYFLIVLIILVTSIAGIVEIIPIISKKHTTETLIGIKPYNAIQLIGRDIYLREGCYLCHSQMIRPFKFETERYGHYSMEGESIYDHPFQWGSKRNGPDLSRIGNKYSDVWHERHLNNPRDVVHESNMPSFPWLSKKINNKNIIKKMKKLKILGVPYTKKDIIKSKEETKDKTEQEALISYLQILGGKLKIVY